MTETPEHQGLSRDDPGVEESDGPPDELEPGAVVEAELGRLVHHPKQEAARLKRVAAEGEEGSAPFIQVALVARWIIPLLIVLAGIVLLVYYKA